MGKLVYPGIDGFDQYMGIFFLLIRRGSEMLEDEEIPRLSSSEQIRSSRYEVLFSFMEIFFQCFLFRNRSGDDRLMLFVFFSLAVLYPGIDLLIGSLLHIGITHRIISGRRRDIIDRRILRLRIRSKFCEFLLEDILELIEEAYGSQPWLIGQHHDIEIFPLSESLDLCKRVLYGRLGNISIMIDSEIEDIIGRSDIHLLEDLAQDLLQRFELVIDERDILFSRDRFEETLIRSR